MEKGGGQSPFHKSANHNSSSPPDATLTARLNEDQLRTSGAAERHAESPVQSSAPVRIEDGWVPSSKLTRNLGRRPAPSVGPSPAGGPADGLKT